MLKDWLIVWTIYDHPRDHPDHWVVRPFYHKRGEVRCGHGSGEAGNGIVGLMDPHQRRGLGADRSLVIARVGAVGRADLTQDRT